MSPWHAKKKSVVLSKTTMRGPKNIRDTPRIGLNQTKHIQCAEQMARMAAENNHRTLREDAMSVREQWVVKR